MRLKDKVAVVTGSGGGLGRATCRLFAEEGATVAGVDINREAGKKTRDFVRGAGGTTEYFQTDITSEDEVKSLFDRVVSKFGRIDILVNNAASFVLKSIDASPEEWRKNLDVNVIGTALCTKHAAEDMKKRKRGAIVNLGSISAVIAQPAQMTYNATKAAIVAMTKCTALDLAPFNIRVNAVCPGYIRTDQLIEAVEAEGKDVDAAVRDWSGYHLLNRLADPREIAYSILFLASEESSFCTGSALFADGGYTAR